MAQERKGIVTLKGNPMTLLGPELKAGDKAPDFSVIDGTLKPVTLKDSAGKVRIFSTVPSLDTPVCDQQTRELKDKSASIKDQVAVITISVDLPFAQKRWCTAADAEGKIQFLSDHREVSFGTSYGVAMKEPRLLARSIIVVGKDDKVKYVQIVPEVATLPNVDAAIAAARDAAK